MSRFETLVCDEDGTEEVTPAYGWLSVKSTRGSTTQLGSGDKIDYDFCSPECLVTKFGAVVLQTQLELVGKQIEGAMDADEDGKGPPHTPQMGTDGG